MNRDKITYFAQTDARARRDKFGIKADDRTRHMYIIGKTGMGKSTLIENLLAQDIQNGEGAAFIDPHGGSAEKMLDYVPKDRIDDVVYFAPFDMEYPIAFNVMEDVGYDKRHLVVSGLMSTFEKIWEDAWSARMEYILSNTLLALLEYPGSTMLDVNTMYTDPNFRKKVVANAKDPQVKSFWEDEFANYSERYAQEATPAIQNKIGQFTGNPLIRNIIGQQHSSFDIRDIIDNKKILICNLSKGRVGESNANLLGSMLITKIYLAAMSRADASAEQLKGLPNFYFYVDEFQSFANKSFADILSEARKYKLNLTIAHQYIEQMSEEVRAAVFGNVGTMITFRVGAYDAEVLEKEFTPQFYADDLVNLGFAQIYLKLMIDGVGSQPFSATTLPPVEPPEISYKEHVIEASRKNYAAPRAEVEGRIMKEIETRIQEKLEAHKAASAAGQKRSQDGRGKPERGRAPVERKSSEERRAPKQPSPKDVFKEMEQSNHKDQLAEIAAAMGSPIKKKEKKDQSTQKKDNLPPGKKVDGNKSKEDLKNALAGILSGTQTEASQKEKKAKRIIEKPHTETKQPKKEAGRQEDARDTTTPSKGDSGEVSVDELKRALEIEGDKQ